LRGVIRAKTRATHRHAMTIAFAPRQIEYVVDDDIFVGVVRAHTVSGMNSLIVEAFQINRVWAVHRYLSGIDIAGHGTDQTEIFVLVITAE
jgi:hypothetical protein